MSLNRRSVILMSLLLAACSSGSSQSDAGTGSDAGATSRLTINGSTGLRMVQFQTKDEPPLAGTVLIKFDGKETSSATVKVNGTALVAQSASGAGPVGYYEADPNHPATIGSDLKMTIEASQNGETSTITVDCPADITVNVTPANNSTLAAGGTVTASWTANLWINPPTGLMDPGLTLRGYNASDKSVDDSSQPATASMTQGATSGTVTAGTTSFPGYLLDFQIPGLYKLENGNSAICYRVRRFTYVK